MTPEKMQKMMMMVRMLRGGQNGVIRPNPFIDPGMIRPIPEGYGPGVDPGPEAGGDSSMHPELDSIPDLTPNPDDLIQPRDKGEAMRRQMILMEAMKNQQKGPY